MTTSTLPRRTEHADLNEPVIPSSVALKNPPDNSKLKVTYGRVIASEWVKFISLRSIRWLLAATALLVVAFGALASSVASSIEMPVAAAGGAMAMPAMTPAEVSLAGVQFALLLVGILGVMYATGEYSTGMIRTSFNAVPKRLPILVGKAVVLGVSVLVTMLVACFAAFYVGQLFYDANAASITDDGVIGMIVGNGFYLAGVALVGLALGMLLRSTSGAIAAYVGTFMLLPVLVALILPESWSNTISPYLPSEAGSVFTSITVNPDMLTTGPAIAVFAAWVFGLIAVAAVLIKRRDA